MKIHKKTSMLVFIALLVSSIVFAATIEDYVASLDTSFYDGTINITTFSDKIVDGDSNGQNDTIVFRNFYHGRTGHFRFKQNIKRYLDEKE